MKEKKWYRKPATKGILLILQYIFLGGMVACGMFVFTLMSNGLRFSDHSDNYFDSDTFHSTFYAQTRELSQAISGTVYYSDFIGEKDTTGDNTVLDLNEVLNDEDFTFQNRSGLAYSLKDLKAWSQNDDYFSDNGKYIVICHDPDSDRLPYQYYYTDDFLDKLENGEFSLQIAPTSDVSEYDYYASTEAELRQWEDQLQEEVKYNLQNGYLDQDYDHEIQVKDSNGTTLYDSIYSYRGNYIQEMYSPQGAESLLDVLNRVPQWNNRLEEAFDALDTILGRLNFYTSESDALDNYENKISNITYLYVNGDNGQVVSNDEQLKKDCQSYLASRSSSGKELSQDITAASDYYEDLKTLLQEKKQISYILVQAGPDGFDSNLSNLANTIFPMEEEKLSTDNWHDLICSTLPEVNNNFVFAAYVDQTLPVSDVFSSEKAFFDKYSSYLKPVCILFFVCILLFVVSFIWLTISAGQNAAGSDVTLCFFDRWPTEISAALIICLWILPLAWLVRHLALYQITRLLTNFRLNLILLLGSGFYTLFFFQIGYLSLVRRIKAKNLWKNSLLRKIFQLIHALFQKINNKTHALIDFYSRNTTAKVKVTVAFLAFIFIKYILCALLLGSGRLFFTVSLLADLMILIFAMKKAYRRDLLIHGLQTISSGNLQYKIPLESLSGDDRRMAEYINNIGSGLDAAVENSIKNERMKTELITNVSHDLKTPLTSIISYIDLLKRENFEDAKVCEYLGILEQKAARLKVLTEDVVEASKASTGNLTLDMADLNFAEMLHQVIGEFEERFQEHRLTMVAHFPKEATVIHADGQRMWRVLENVFGNVTKYAMEGTRVYAEVRNSENQVIFSLKNISAQPLNFAAEELTERFVRGDVARNTEGSGLGLSIAKSLTELQGGKFQLYLDGDLFKVTICFKAKKAEPSTL